MSRPSLILRRSLDMIDDQDLDRAILRFEFQPQLLLQILLKLRSSLARVSVSRNWQDFLGRPRAVKLRRPLEREIKTSAEPGPIQHRAIQVPDLSQCGREQSDGESSRASTQPARWTRWHSFDAATHGWEPTGDGGRRRACHASARLRKCGRARRVLRVRLKLWPRRSRLNQNKGEHRKSACLVVTRQLESIRN